MSYPKIIITRPYRIAIMAFWVMLFLVAAPLTILYTAGYRYDFVNHAIRQTGVFSVDVQPKDASVFINNVPIKKTIPLRLTNRAPGNYLLRVSRDGYRDWEKTIIVDSNKTTFIRNISLFKDSLPYPFLTDAYFSITALYPGVFNDSLLFSTEDDGIYELYRLSLKEDPPQPSLLLRQSFASAPHISWSQRADLFLVDMTDLGGRLFVFDNNEQRVSIDGPLSSPAQWHDRYGLVVALDGSLFSMQPTKELTRLPYTPTSSIWYLDAGEQLWEYNAISNRIEQFDQQGQLLVSMELPQEFTVTSFLDVNDHRILLQTPTGILLFSLSDDHSIQTFANMQSMYNRQTNEWLLWSETELWSIFADGTFALIERTGEPLHSVHPLDEHGQLLLHKGDKLEVYNPGYQVRDTLFENADIEHIAVDILGKRIFILGTIAEKRDLFVLEY